MSSRISVASILAESANRYPETDALVLGEVRVSYAVAWDQARRYAAVLRDRGIKPGDRVAVLIPNVPQFAFAYYGILALGACVVPIHSLLKSEEIAYALKDSGSKVLIAAAPLIGEGLPAALELGVDIVSVLDGGPEEIVRLESLAAVATPIETYLARKPEDEAVILYTSGTTGKPKGAILTQDNILWNVQTVAFDTIELKHGDVLLGALPLFHSFGQTVVLNAGFRVGATIALVPRFEPGAVLDLLLKEKVTIMVGVPTMFIGLLEAAKTNSIRPPLRIAVSGGSALPLAVIDKVKEVFGVDIYEGYGLSETSPVATFNQERYGRKPGTVGCAIWGVDVEIADPEISDRIEFLPVGERGEIVIRGSNVFNGYLNKPEETAQVVIDGWFRSGDIGLKDDEGFISIVDRTKDMIIRGGFNVYPREVEEVINRYPGIKQVAVIGVPDDVHGEEILAVVIADESVVIDELREWTKGHIGSHKYPRRIEFIDEMPLGPSGKVLKRVLVERFS
ncbi:MAG TPA: long-chain fatty acid--CoA ligase [Candidatus Nanopelagicaceae bacterium]|nr:long-chain fatty acid--CoA ligase [Candidatus Nanopelagicaceae bacterium]